MVWRSIAQCDSGQLLPFSVSGVDLGGLANACFGVRAVSYVINVRYLFRGKGQISVVSGKLGMQKAARFNSVSESGER